MKAILIFYHVEYDEDLMAILEKTGIKCYSKLERVLGKGKHSEPRLDTSVWPGFNSALIIATEEEEKREKFLEELKKYTNKLKGKGICVFVLPLERII
ncbi:MAG TPA: transcriptional regulator [Candidatus Desulfofervidus auxilii]|uniref:Transcriptional regulator n=1 Tax=Desulfofervidus auxilii TaxID=1621989 RepID=A0A7C2AED0_DESA2|nr:transcriptional regulator [Candidatus Desulfofervidus auxilii]